MTARGLRCGLLLAACAVALGTSSSVQAAGLRPLGLAFYDTLFGSDNAAVRDQWLKRSAALGAQIVRLNVGWPAAQRPAEPTNPADPAYYFTADDAMVRAAAAHGLTALLSFSGAPTWAEGPRRPASAAPASWLPDTAAVGAYGQALATRYDGRFPDPQHPGATLPRVTTFQVWNEPNLSQYLSPQWEHRDGAWIPEASIEYRAMLNAFYAGVKAAQPAATVVTAGTAPYGDFGHGQRTMPVLFWADVFSAPVNFDVLAHQPYGVAAPTQHALNVDDVSVPDLGKLTRLLRAAERRGTARPSGERHPLWVTETGYNTKPPDPTGVPLETDARWLEQSLYLFWRQGVDVVTWFLVRDAPPSSVPGESSATGVYFIGGRPKPASLAYRFPVVGHRAAGGGIRAWIRAPATGTLALDAEEHGRWRTIATTAVDRTEILDPAVPAGAQAVRASLAGLRSLAWTF